METCSMEGCEKPHKGRGYCEMHLARWRRHGDPSVVRVKQPNPDRPRTVCSVDGCAKFTVGQGLCRSHYMRKRRRGGDPAVTLPRGNFSTPVSTRTHMFEQGDPSECWEWQGSRNKNGYGTTGKSGQFMLAHRAVYLEMVGPIEEHMTLDHLCSNILCVNPAHLDPCTRRENMLRGGGEHFELRGKTGRVVYD